MTWHLTESEEDTLDEAIRLDRANTEHTSADTCQVCGGYGCDRCRNCPCSRCDPYVPEHIRNALRR